MLISVKGNCLCHLTIVSQRDLFNFNRHDLFAEPLYLIGGGRLFVAAEGEFVLGYSAHIKLGGNLLRGEPHPHLDIRIILHHLRIGADPKACHGNQTHCLRPAGDNAISSIGDNSFRGDGDCL